MISVELWRARIGTFNNKRCSGCSLSSLSSASSPSSYRHCRRHRGSTDISQEEPAEPTSVVLTSSSSSSLVAEEQSQAFSSSDHHSVLTTSSSQLTLSCSQSYGSGSFSAPSALGSSSSFFPTSGSLLRSLLRDAVITLLIAIISQLLMVAGDIETNPGPKHGVYDKPGLADLLSMPYTGEDGRDRHFRLMDQLRPHWKRLAVALKFHHSDITAMERKDDSVVYLLSKWLRGDNQEWDSRPVTWATLITALREANVHEEADILEKHFVQIKMSQAEAPRPTMSDLISMRTRDGSNENLKIMDWISSHESTKCLDFAHKLLNDRIPVKELRKEYSNDDEFVQAVLVEWVSRDDDSREDSLPCTWNTLVQCVDESGLDGEFLKLLKDNVPTGDEDHTSTTADEDTHTGTSPDAVGTQNRNLVKKYIEQQGSLPVRSMKSFLIGPPCVGKTSARRRLMGEIKHISADEIVPSTGIDAPLTVRLHHPTEYSSVLLSEGWHNQGLEDQCRALCSYALNTLAPPPVLSSSTSATPSSTITVSPVAAIHRITPLSKLTTLFKRTYMYSHLSQPTVTTTQDAAQATYDTAIAAQDELTTALTTLVKADDWKSIRDFLTNTNELAFLNIVDIGGQPEFHEILPLLSHGLALNLIFLNTTRDLDSPYTVVYRDGTGNSPQYTSEFTIRQVIQRALCAISSLQTSDEENKSAAILIGTYCDLTDESAVLALDQSIQESFKEADFMKKDVLCAVNKPGEKRRYIYPLDNVSGDPSEIDELRQLISTIVYSHRFKPVSVPTSALLLHLILRMKFGHTRGWCTLEECIKIAKNCGISKEDLLREDGILQYLHDKFGTVLYYRKVKKLCLRVIVNTKVIKGPPSRLFLMAFGALKTEQQTAEHIRATGEISHYLMKKVCSPDDDTSDDGISADEIVELLKARYIIFEYSRSFANEPVYYFMPALLYPDHNVAKESSNPDHLASLPFPPVVFLPSSGDVPLGQFPATAVNLSKYWKPDEKNRYRNRIRFYAKCKHDRLLHVELRNLSTHFEFRVLPKPSINTSLMVESIQKLLKVFAELSSLYSHTQNITWSVGFYCPHSLQSGQQPHTATCFSKDNPQEMICSQRDCEGGLIPLNDKHKSWFMKEPCLEKGVTITTATGGTHVVQDCRPLNLSKAIMKFPDPAAFWRLDNEPACKYTGEGVSLLVFDTGIATTLRCFASREVGKSLLFVNPDVPNDDNDGHGSFCARISCGDQFEGASNGKAFTCRGVAPGATLSIWKGYEHGEEDVNEECTSEWSSQLDQMVEQVGSSVDVVVISSCSEVYNSAAKESIQTLHAENVIVVCAAGNHGKEDKVNIRFPASLNEVICVGAHNRYGQQCSFSSRDVISTRKCDVLALGDDVIGLKLDGSLTKRGGTSIAAPAVGGLICLILQAVKERCGEIDCATIKNNRAMKLMLQELVTSPDKPVISHTELKSFFRDPMHYVDKLKSNGLIGQ